LIEKTVLERTKDLNDAKKKLEALSHTDSLTNIGNRRSYDETLEIEWNRAIRDKMPLSLRMIDINYFKLFNDKYGHAAGDKCLKDLAYTMEKSLRRTSDKVTRYGGEEFVIILPNTQDTFSCAEDCRQSII
jgi:diguanylate cyclase (GGDEF)-like protein